jgi:hypothetical protein
MQAPHADAYLQLGDDKGSKGFLMPRVELTSTSLSAPLKMHVAGMQVYNTATINDVTPGPYYNDGQKWRAFTGSLSGNFISYSDSLVVFVTPTQLENAIQSLGRNNDSISLSGLQANNGISMLGSTIQLGGTLTKPTNIATTASNTFSISGLQPGSLIDSILVIDKMTNQLKTISAAAIFNSINAGNGITNAGGQIMLGGALSQPTVISADASNTLSIKGLQNGQSTTDSLLTIEPNTGIIRKISNSALGAGMIKQVIAATGGQTAFTTPWVITSLDKIQVFRNGAQIEFSGTVGDNKITLLQLYNDTNYACLDGDEIKIYQWK